MKQKSIIYIISLVNNSVLFRRTIAMLRKENYAVSVILLHHETTPFEQELKTDGVPVTRLHYKTKRNLLRVVMQLARILRTERDSIVHTHLFEAGLAGMIAAKLSGVKRRIHTRHDAMIHHDFHPSAVKYDEMTNHRATEIIAITDNVRKILMEKENVPAEKIHVVHHGFSIKDYGQPDEHELSEFYKRYPQLQNAQPVIGVISRFIEWKGIQYIIAAFKDVLQQHPDAHLVVANARGPYAQQLLLLLSEIPSERFTLIEHEPAIAALYHSFDVFVHVPVDELSEAFGQVYIEAMAAGIPSVITRSGIACDYAVDRVNCMLVPHKNSIAIAGAINELCAGSSLQETLRTNGLRLVNDEYTLEKMTERLSAIYGR